MDFKRILKPKIIIPIVAGILLLIPIIQNMQRVFLQFYFWEIRMSQALLIILVFSLGVLSGMGLVYLQKYLKKRKSSSE